MDRKEKGGCVQIRIHPFVRRLAYRRCRLAKRRWGAHATVGEAAGVYDACANACTEGSSSVRYSLFSLFANIPLYRPLSVSCVRLGLHAGGTAWREQGGEDVCPHRSRALGNVVQHDRRNPTSSRVCSDATARHGWVRVDGVVDARAADDGGAAAAAAIPTATYDDATTTAPDAAAVSATTVSAASSAPASANAASSTTAATASSRNGIVLRQLRGSNARR